MMKFIDFQTLFIPGDPKKKFLDLQSMEVGKDTFGDYRGPVDFD